MSLNSARIRNIKPEDKIRRFFDTNGLYLEVSPKGGRWWRFKYRFEGREKRISLGVYPQVSLKDARLKREEYRSLLAKEIDPGKQRKERKEALEYKIKNNFEALGREWHTKNLVKWTSGYAKHTIRRLERDIFPFIGKKSLVDIKSREILDTVRKIENRGKKETAHRLLGVCSQIFNYAITTGIIEHNPTIGLKGALSPVLKTHFAAVTEPDKIAELLRMLDGYEGSNIVHQALRLAPLVFVRPGELRTAKWEDMDFEKKEWRYFVTKTKTDHIVPLARQSINILKDLKPFSGNNEYLFPSLRSPKRPMSDMALLAAMRRIGIPKEEMTPHGFRAMARTVLDEILKFRVDIIEHQLAHAVRDPNGRAYNRTAHLDERRKMMQRWADYLDELKCKE